MDFAYTAIDPRGARVREQIAAESEDQAVRRLQSQGLTVLEIGPARAAGVRGGRRTGSFPAGGRRVKLDQIAPLTRELAVMIETGVPVSEAFGALAQHAVSPAIRQALARVNEELEEGRSISQALAAHPRIFPKLYVDMVRTAETGGRLDEALNQAADYLEAALEMRRKVAAAMTYPLVLLAVAAGVLVFMLTYLLPQFSALFARTGAPLPPSTRLVLAASALVRSHWWLLPVVAAGGFRGLAALRRWPPGAVLLARIALSLPVIGDLARKVAMARSMRALGTLNATGVSLLLALETAAQTSQNPVFERAMMRMRDQVEEGTSLSEAAAAVGVFPATVCQMLVVGEKSGRLSPVLLRMAAFFEKDVDARLKMLTSVIEPVMIVLLGIIIGFVAVSIISPIYSLVGNVK